MSPPAVGRRAEPGVRPDGYVCSCLRVTEERLLEVLANPRVATLRDVRGAIGAGDGCTACHRALRRYLDAAGQSPCPPVCPAR